MPRPVRKRYKPTTQTKPGQIGPEEGTSEWAMLRRREAVEERAAEKWLSVTQRAREEEEELNRPLYAVAFRFFVLRPCKGLVHGILKLVRRGKAKAA
jgi:hypothetical protein